MICTDHRRSGLAATSFSGGGSGGAGGGAESSACGTTFSVKNLLGDDDDDDAKDVALTSEAATAASALVAVSTGGSFCTDLSNMAMRRAAVNGVSTPGVCGIIGGSNSTTRVSPAAGVGCRNIVGEVAASTADYLGEPLFFYDGTAPAATSTVAAVAGDDDDDAMQIGLTTHHRRSTMMTCPTNTYGLLQHHYEQHRRNASSSSSSLPYYSMSAGGLHALTPSSLASFSSSSSPLPNFSSSTRTSPHIVYGLRHTAASTIYRQLQQEDRKDIRVQQLPPIDGLETAGDFFYSSRSTSGIDASSSSTSSSAIPAAVVRSSHPVFRYGGDFYAASGYRQQQQQPPPTTSSYNYPPKVSLQQQQKQQLAGVGLSAHYNTGYDRSSGSSELAPTSMIDIQLIGRVQSSNIGGGGGGGGGYSLMDTAGIPSLYGAISDVGSDSNLHIGQSSGATTTTLFGANKTVEVSACAVEAMRGFGRCASPSDYICLTDEAKIYQLDKGL